MFGHWRHGEKGRGPVVLVGLDACDPTTIRRMAATGELPHIARLLAEGSRAAVRNPYGVFVGAVWINFMTGVGPARHDFICWDHIDRHDYAYRLTPPHIAHPPFWEQLGAAGRRVALIDIPHSRFPAPVNGVAIAEWGCHDRHFGFHTQPAERRAALDAEHGLHPVFGLDPYRVRDFAPDDHVHRTGRTRTPEEYEALVAALLDGVAAKARLVEAVLAEEDWDLAIAVFGEAHAAGHQLWSLHDPAHPDFDPGLQAALGGDPVARVYRALDAAVGRLAAGLGDEATLCLLLSHGMGRHHDGTHLLGELLKRLDDAYRPGGASLSPYGLLRRTLQGAQPAADRAARALRVPGTLRRSMNRKLGARAFGSAAERARQAFFIAPNNHVYGGIRFNLVGREAEGRVTPDEAETLARRLEADLKAIVNDATGRPIVRGLRRSDAFHARRPDDCMPDLFIDWARDAPIESVSSPLIGRVRAPYDCWRTGDHRPGGLLVARGPGLPADRAFPRLRMEDLPVSLAARLGVALADVDGEAAPWLAAPAQPPVSAAGAERHS